MWIFSEQELMDSPSRRDGVPRHTMDLYRIRCCEFIEKMGAIFRLPPLSIASGKIFFHRFFAVQSYKAYDAWRIAATCLFLAAKVEEHYMKIPDYTKHYLAQRKKLTHDAKLPESIRPIMPTNPTVEAETETILFTECILLHVLAYDLNVIHPYTFVADFVAAALNAAGAVSDANTKALKKAAWSFINDTSKSTVCLRYKPRHIAAVAVYLAGCYETLWPTGSLAPDGTPWSTLLSVPDDVLRGSVVMVLTTYSRVEYHKNRPLVPGIQRLLETNSIPKHSQ
ncbi:hypothetical protein SDRG_14450 [Saprolegnia diclina VS20]|uniref:Cyclin-like domain-containing protein n=1 Tax=Saprolegnia diclina (strain VS20) TaxID=1156394 RepID=T0Q037_SAPDV|nr:hypothetical protein SDRG_14450 [Saprolegnia diclina VS20]EQC27871.1 hypothetical protein SDRG_14450 [Saprolegnia diclina VS20]|eukprot:XP_008618801.1 hypothetical protein SDRG_14450 [Saprolegnia diclina VS20]